jgi:hypothetical protein
MRTTLLGALSLALISCGGSNATFIRVVSTPPTVASGTNCGSTNNGVVTTVTNEGPIDDVVIFAVPSGPCTQGTCTAVLSLGATTLLNGTQNGNTYTFLGKVIDDTKTTNNETINEQDTTVTVTVNGSAVSGSASIETKSTCQSGCGGVENSDCTSSYQFQGTTVPGTQIQTQIDSTQP